MRSAFVLQLAGVALFCGACSLAPRHVLPELPTAAMYPTEYSGDTAAGTQAPTLGWRDFFADPRLELIVQRALANNRDLKVAVSQIEEARSLYRIQRADALPTIAVSAEASRNHAGAQALGATSGRELGAGSTGVGAVTYERYAVSAGFASFEVDFWGSVHNLSEAARASYLSSVSAARAFQLSLIRDVSNAYLASLEARERLQLAEATVRSRREAAYRQAPLGCGRHVRARLQPSGNAAHPSGNRARRVEADAGAEREPAHDARRRTDRW